MTSQYGQPATALWAAFACVLVAVIAGLVGSTPIALVGAIGALTAAGLEIWQRQCLTGVSYRRSIAFTRAQFGDEVALQLELINDKLLPITWLRVEDEFPTHLTVRGGVVTMARSRARARATLVQVFPMLPFQRVRRRMTIVCDRRGLHVFGPVRLTSGDPLGYRERWLDTTSFQTLLIYPKVFALEPPQLASRLPLGNQRANALLGDPSAPAGVREYQAGDPVRHIDWRATARSTTLLVREFDPTASLRVAVFVDLSLPASVAYDGYSPELEFTISVAASVINSLIAANVSTGLYSSALAGGDPISVAPTQQPAALAQMLDLLARASPAGRSLRFADLLVGRAGMRDTRTSVVVIASDFPEQTLVAMSEVRRHSSLSALWVQTGSGAAAPDALADVHLRAVYSEDWVEGDTLELAA